MNNEFYEIEVNDGEENANILSQDNNNDNNKTKNKKFIHRRSVRKSRAKSRREILESDKQSLSDNDLSNEKDDVNIYYEQNPKYEIDEDLKKKFEINMSLKSDKENHINKKHVENVNELIQNVDANINKICNRCVFGSCKKICNQEPIIKKTMSVEIPHYYKDFFLNQNTDNDKIKLFSLFKEIENLKTENKFISEEYYGILITILIFSPYFLYIGIRDNNRIHCFLGIFGLIFTISNLIVNNLDHDFFFEKLLF